jgi:hypothetical protein
MRSMLIHRKTTTFFAAPQVFGLVPFFAAPQVFGLIRFSLKKTIATFIASKAKST